MESTNNADQDINDLIRKLQQYLPVLEIFTRKCSDNPSADAQRKYAKAMSFYDRIRSETRLRTLSKTNLQNYLQILKKMSTDLNLTQPVETNGQNMVNANEQNQHPIQPATTAAAAAAAAESNVEVFPLKLEMDNVDDATELFHRRPRNASPVNVTETIDLTDSEEPVVLIDSDSDTEAPVKNQNNVYEEDDKRSLEEAKSKLKAIMARFAKKNDSAEEIARKSSEQTSEEQSICDLARQITYNMVSDYSNENIIHETANRIRPNRTDSSTATNNVLVGSSNNNIPNETSNDSRRYPPAADRYANIKNIAIVKRPQRSFRTSSDANADEEQSNAADVNFKSTQGNTTLDVDLDDSDPESDVTVDFDDYTSNPRKASSRSSLNKDEEFTESRIDVSCDFHKPCTSAKNLNQGKNSNDTKNNISQKSRELFREKAAALFNRPTRQITRRKSTSELCLDESERMSWKEQMGGNSDRRGTTVQTHSGRTSPVQMRSGRATPLLDKAFSVLSRELRNLQNDTSFHNRPPLLRCRRKSIAAFDENLYKESSSEDEASDSSNSSEKSHSSPSEESSDTASTDSEASSSSSSSTDEAMQVQKRKHTRRVRRSTKTFHPQKAPHTQKAPHSQTVPKNTDRNMCEANPTYKSKCVICLKEYKYIVNHYIREHPSVEIYVSRLSEDMADVIINSSIPSERGEDNTLISFCYFCERNASYQDHYWSQHILMHTGEYQYFCHRCNHPINSNVYHNRNCKSVTRRYRYEFKSGRLTAFLCKLCNYVQVRKKNMISHLCTQHDLQNEACENMYQVITLVQLPGETFFSTSTVQKSGSKSTIKVASTTNQNITGISNPNAAGVSIQNVTGSIANVTIKIESHSDEEVVEEQSPIEIIYMRPDGRADIQTENFGNEAIRLDEQEPRQDEHSNQNENVGTTMECVKEELMELENEGAANIARTDPISESPALEPSTSVPEASATIMVVPQISSVETIKDKAIIAELKLSTANSTTAPAQQPEINDTAPEPPSKKYPRIKITPKKEPNGNGAQQQVQFVPVMEKVNPVITQEFKVKQEPTADTGFVFDESMQQSFEKLYHMDYTVPPKLSGKTKTNLKPWAKEPRFTRNISKKLSDIFLYARYKCMASQCLFATEDEREMQTHLRHHVLFKNFIEKKFNKSVDLHWTECSYCDYKTDTVCTDLINHINNEHATSRLQCPYCYYRTIELHNIVLHLNDFHKQNVKRVLICDAVKPLLLKEKLRMLESRRINASEYLCGLECTRNRFLLSEHFLYHLSDTTNHKDIFNFKCPQCEILLAKSKAGMHFMLHGLFEFHCLHCQTGLRDIGKLRAHISTRHPSKLLFATARKLRKDLSIEQINPHDIDSLVIVNISPSSTTDLSGIQFIRCPYDSQELSFMKPELTAMVYNSMSPRNSMNATLVSEAEMKDMVTEYTLQSSKDQFLTYDDYIANYRDTKIPLQQMELWETVNGNFIVMDVNTSNTDLSIRTDCSGDFSEMAKQLELNLMKIESIDADISNVPEEDVDNQPTVQIAQQLNKYVCGTKNCQHSTESLYTFHHHLRQMHLNEKYFKCMVCNEELCMNNVINIKAIMDHLNLHETVSECGLCKVSEVGPVTSIIKHYKDCHPSEEIKIIQKSLKNGEMDVKYVKYKFICKLCNFTRDTESAIVQHFIKHNEPNPSYLLWATLIQLNEADVINADKQDNANTSTISNISSNSHILLYHCCYCTLKFKQLKQLHNHWRKVHEQVEPTTSSSVYPFRFSVEKLYACNYCQETGSFKSIKSHITNLHTGEKFAIVDYSNSEQCGQCSFTFTAQMEHEFLNHYENAHNQNEHADLVARFSFLSDDFLQKLLNITFDKRLKCGICTNYLCYTQEDLYLHFNERHTKEPVQYVPLDENRIIYRASCCRHTFSDEFEVIKHIWRHTKKYQCNFCDKKFDNFTTLQSHHRTAHETTDAMYRDETEVLSSYLDIQFIFGNGLTLTKQALHFTKYGAMEQYTTTINQLNAESRRFYSCHLNNMQSKADTPMNNSQKSDNLQPVIRFKRKNRSQMVCSSSESSEGMNKVVYRNTRAAKRRRLLSKSPSPPPPSNTAQQICNYKLKDFSIILDKSFVDKYIAEQ